MQEIISTLNIVIVLMMLLIGLIFIISLLLYFFTEKKDQYKRQVIRGFLSLLVIIFIFEIYDALLWLITLLGIFSSIVYLMIILCGLWWMVDDSLLDNVLELK